MTEADIERRFVTYANSKGCQALKLRIDGIDGFPDRTVLAPDGPVYFVEFKWPGGKLRPTQRVWANILSRLGFIVWVEDSVDRACRRLDGFLAS